MQVQSIDGAKVKAKKSYQQELLNIKNHGDDWVPTILQLFYCYNFLGLQAVFNLKRKQTKNTQTIIAKQRESISYFIFRLIIRVS